ncbi:MAG: exodeoxyribonuclease VII small subunit [Clostridiales bacterium]|nr:exodeoxyribonuclease VII small subunit [Clostridiales bacterium]
MDNSAKDLSALNNDAEHTQDTAGDSATIEERFDTIDRIIERMDEDDVPLEEAFALYQSGLAQVKAANEMLDSMEKALLVMNESGELEDFE